MSKKGLHWPVGIIIFFSLFFIALIIFLIFALSGKSDLVERDYYRKGIDYQKQIDRINRTNASGKKLTWHYSKSRGQLSLQYPTQNTTGIVLFYRPSDANADRQFTIEPDDSAKQFIDISSLKSGLWKLKINWQIEENKYYTEEVLIVGSD
jgi:nitrogen fixation protein FixH